MATGGGVDEIVAQFYLDTSLRNQWNWYKFWMVLRCTEFATRQRHLSGGRIVEAIPTSTGSNAEFYIEPMFTCTGDFDIMFHRSDQLAIPAEYPPPTELPAEFHSCVNVYRIINSEFPGYVNLVLSDVLTENAVDGTYGDLQISQKFISHRDLIGTMLELDDGDTPIRYCKSHGPAFIYEWFGEKPPTSFARVDGLRFGCDRVPCVRCLSWPTQAGDWPTRRRNHGCPDLETVVRVVSNGCDVVFVAHHLCRQNELKDQYQFRLSFSRAEIILLNSWIPEEQIVYHMLRLFMKIEKLTDGSNALSNYHVKTLMLWVCELTSKRWWTGDMNVVEICVYVLHVLGVLLLAGQCEHYFISNCNLLHQCDNETARKLLSVKKEWLANWFVDNCIRKCAESRHFNQFVDDDDEIMSRLFDDVSSSTKLRCAVSTVIDCRKKLWLIHAEYLRRQRLFSIYNESLTMCSSLCWLQELAKFDEKLCIYFTIVAFLHVALKTTQNSLTHQLLGSLVVICRHLVNTMSSTTDEVQKLFCNELRQFVAEVPILNLLFHAKTARSSRLLIIIEARISTGHKKPG